MSLPLTNLALVGMLTGLIWTIQLVHYPLFARVPESGWVAYESEHQKRITALVLPLMAASLGLAAALVIESPGALVAAHAILAATLFVGTGLVFAPLHGKLARRFDADDHARLVRLNWLRTAAWTAQLACAYAIAHGAA